MAPVPADEISTGLDSATITDAMQVFRLAVDNYKSTAIVSLLQPPPEVYELFDNIMLMREGRIVYHGAWATGCCQCRVVSLLVSGVDTCRVTNDGWMVALGQVLVDWCCRTSRTWVWCAPTTRTRLVCVDTAVAMDRAVTSVCNCNITGDALTVRCHCFMELWLWWLMTGCRLLHRLPV